jgi:hypothetical protein
MKWKILSMNKFIKENIVLIIGISLPLTLVVLFMLASYVPQLLVENPRYDFLFTDESSEEVQWDVIDHQLNFKIARVRHREKPVIPHLYRYSASTGNVTEITFTPPDLSKQIYQSYSSNTINANVVIPIDPSKAPSDEQIQNTNSIITRLNQSQSPSHLRLPVSETATLHLDSKREAPDGYEFKAGHYGYTGGGVLLMTHGRYKQHESTLRKNGKNIPIRHQSTDEYSNHTPHFIGWIIP